MHWLGMKSYLFRVPGLWFAWQKLVSPAEVWIVPTDIFRLHKRSVVKQTSWLSWQLSHIELRDWSNCELEKPPSIGGIFDCYNTSHCLFWKWHPIYFVRHIDNGRKGEVTGQQFTHRLSRGRGKFQLFVAVWEDNLYKIKEINKALQ